MLLLLLLASTSIIVIIVIGIFRWKRAMEPPVKAIERQGRKKWAEMNRTRNEKFEDNFFDDFHNGLTGFDITSTGYTLSHDDD